MTSKTYLVAYSYQGQKYDLELPAESWQDAQQRLRALASGEVIGEVQAKIFIPIPARVFEWAMQRWRALRDN